MPPPRRQVVDESEAEDQPRIVLDVHRDFTLTGANPPTVFKLHEFDPQVEGPNGELIPYQGVLAVRPVPIPADVARAKAAMGQGVNGVWTGTRFNSTESPDFLFPVRTVNTPGQHVLERFCIRRRFAPQISGLKTMLIYTDGACTNNGAVDKDDNVPRGGSAFVFNHHPSGTQSFALETQGPDGQVYPHTCNRAELRAVIAALAFRIWWGEGWERLVIATDSEYVGKGATEWLRSWAGRDWRTSGSKHVANQDLWRALSEALGSYAEAGCEVSFWMVPRQANGKADAAAKAAAARGGGHEEYRNTPGVMV